MAKHPRNLYFDFRIDYRLYSGIINLTMKTDKQIFKFKQFEIAQELTAMKVGTDGVLLGAWANLTHAKHILDIGTGTGLIALMCAQRQNNAIIDAIEIDPDAAQQAAGNFNNSKWQRRLNLIHTDFNNFHAGKKYDVIISNPPYFDEQYENPDSQRNMARHTATLSLKTLIKKSKKLLKDDGNIQLILPADKLSQLHQIIEQEKLYLNKICYVKGHKNTKIKRILVKISGLYTKPEEQQLIIEKSRHNYTDDYIYLTRDFYLKM